MAPDVFGGGGLDPSALLSNNAPLSEAGTASAGTMPMAPRGDHRHPRLSATFAGVLDANGSAPVVFTRTFSGIPGMTVIGVENDNTPATEFKVKSWTQDVNGNYTGCVLYGSRARALPALSGIALLTGLTSALANFLPAQAAAGVAFTGFAIQPSVSA
jgi:hypothetical protein